MNVHSLLTNTAKIAHLSLDRKPAALLNRMERELRPTLEMVAAHLALRQNEVFVVQVGANDGRTGDPISQILQRFQWPALLLEPQRAIFEVLKENYQDFPKVRAVNVALSDHNGTQILYSLDPELKEPWWAPGLASFDLNHILKHENIIPNLKQHLREVEVPCRTFDTLFAENGVERVDLLQIDTEGFDAQVLRLFDVARRLPAIVNFEHKHLSMQDWNESVQTLIDCGYHVAKTGADTLAYRFPE